MTGHWFHRSKRRPRLARRRVRRTSPCSLRPTRGGCGTSCRTSRRTSRGLKMRTRFSVRSSAPVRPWCCPCDATRPRRRKRADGFSRPPSWGRFTCCGWRVNSTCSASSWPAARSVSSERRAAHRRGTRRAHHGARRGEGCCDTDLPASRARDGLARLRAPLLPRVGPWESRHRLLPSAIRAGLDDTPLPLTGGDVGGTGCSWPTWSMPFSAQRVWIEVAR